MMIHMLSQRLCKHTEGHIIPFPYAFHCLDLTSQFRSKNVSLAILIIMNYNYINNLLLLFCSCQYNLVFFSLVLVARSYFLLQFSPF